MACQYFVNGEWISEEQFKEVLNNGLLDNLVANGTVKEEGFPVDNTKLLKTETVTTTKTTVPVEKLAAILAKEVSTRSGYPLNMLSALELKEDKSDFKIPLWASPYASKFESLLTSLVSNKVVKQKFAGTSSVLGSEEGFRIKQGDEAAGSLKDSSIVFSDNFDPEKGLQPMRVDPKTGKILPAQIMLPFKFRDESGNILFINDFLKLDSSGRPLRTPDGRVTIDDNKLPAKLRQLFGFRIPTQERNSMAAVEIVGFLPEAMGDLVLAPRDFTKQMGSDFDVDKLYSYLYNHFYKDGKLYTNFPSDKKTIKKLTDAAKEHLATLKSSLKLNSAEQALLNAYIDNKLEKNDDNDQDELLTKATTLIARLTNSPIMEEIENVTNDLSIYNRAYKASRQNKILDIHLSVMLSNNPEVIKSIIALDSFGDFEQLAQDLYKVRSERGLIPPITTILSDTYQRTKYINATAGKTGVGSFSLDSTFNASAQGKELTIINMDDETQTNVFGTPIEPKNPTASEILEANQPLIAFGTNISKGDLSDKYTLRSRNLINKAKEEGRELTEEEKDSLKMKSTIIRSLQSTAVDNEKAQILDKLNINDQTMDAVRALTILGFEEKEIVGLITQEIIWEFTAALKDNGSSLTPFQANAAETLFIDLVKKYDPEGKLAELKPYELEALQSATSESLMNDINTQTLQELSVGPTPDANLRQLAALAKFLKLTQIGKDIKTLQSTINTDSKGVPKSLVETDAKVKQIERLAASNIFNATKLLGEYENGKLVTPTTLNGFASKYGTMFADTIYKQYFPYHTTGFKILVDELLQYIPKGKNASLTKQAELQLELMDAVKSFLYGNANTNLFTENPDSERARLFIDTKTNKSLATILQSVSEEKWYTSNGFLNKLSLDQQKNGQVSRVNFESASGENLDERDIYDGFNYLLSKNFPIGTFNGIDYTSRMLAQDLVASAFLEGGQQGSKQYLKYVPTAYLKTIGFGDYLSNTSFNYLDTFLGNLSPEGHLMYNSPSSFMRQYFQNNADKAKKVSLSDLQGKESNTPKATFTLNEEALKDNIVEITDPYTGEPTTTQTKFLSIYDSKVPGKYALFEFDAVDRLYRRIPTLQGSFGFVSYNSQVGTPLPIEKANRTVKQEGNQEIPGYTLPHTPTTPTKSFDVNVVNNTVKPVTANTLPISKTLSGTKEALDDLINNIQFEDGVSSLNRQLLSSLRDLQLPDNFKVVYDNTLSSRGGYSYDKQTLFINLKHEANQNVDDLATAVAHELIHALTGDAIYEYQKGDLSKLTADQIKAIESLKALQDKYIDHLKTKGEAGALQAFKDKYEAWVERGKTGKVGVSAEDISKFYAGIKLSEFVTMALSDPGFQQHLASVIDESGKSLWEQIKEVLGELLNTLGLDVKPGSALASAIKSSMDLITANQQAMGTKLFVTKIDQFNYSYDAVNNVVIHNAKTGDKVETNDTQINKVLVQYALANNKEQRTFNGSTYVTVADKILNIKNANEVSPETWESAKSTQSSTQQQVPVTEVKEGVVNTKYELFPGVYANKGQTEALDKLTDFLSSDKQAFLLQGKGGTGKTTIIKKIVKEAQAQGNSVLAIAPTHKAKKVLAKSLNDPGIKSTTLAAALAIKLDETTGKFTPDEFARKMDRVPITKTSLVIIDESSMISDKLLEEIKELLPKGTKIIFMGDKAQLPPVGQEKDSAVFDVKNNYTLTEKMRQAATSPIINIGTKVAQNVETTGQRVANPITKEDRVNAFDEVSGSSIIWEDSENKALDAFVEDIKNANGNVDFAKVITFNNQNHNSPQSVKSLNTKIRLKLYGEQANQQQFIPGEILTAYDTFGGEDILFYNSEDLIVKEATEPARKTISVNVTSRQQGNRSKSFEFNIINLTLKNEEGKDITVPIIAESSKEEYQRTLTQLFKTDKQMGYALSSKFGNLEYGYAITSHKAQGSTYTNVYVMEDNIMGSSNGGSMKAKSQSLYVAVSRPTTKLVMVSQKNNQNITEGTFSMSNLGDIDLGNYTDKDNAYSNDDYEAYSREMYNNDQDQLLAESPISRDRLENYLLLCK